MSSNLDFHLGEQGEEFLKKNPDVTSVDRQPAGLNFYNADWKTSAPGTVVFENGKYSFTMANVLSVTGTENVDYPKEGMSEFTINAGISPAELMGHDEARLKLFAIFQHLLQAGWKVSILPNRPRLRGRDMLNYMLNGNRYSTLDAAYLPTLEEWMRIDNSTSWDFYSDHAFLSIYFLRDQNLMDPNKPGAYLLTYDIRSEAEYFRSFVDSKDRKQWKKFLPAELTKLPPLRAAAETEMRAQGLKIDETYRDPLVPDLN
jgi:hypothetical protein